MRCLINLLYILAGTFLNTGGRIMKKLEIVKVIRDGSGDVIAYELDSGSIVDIEQAVYMASNGEIENVEVQYSDEENQELKGKGFDINSLPELK